MSPAVGAGACRLQPLALQLRDPPRRSCRRDARGQQSADGTTVETDVFPVTATPGEPGITRPFAFGSTEHARRFADEALVAFEYLNCTVT